MDKKRLSVGVSGGAIVIRLPLSILAVCLDAAPFNEQPDGSCRPLYRVTNARQFAEEMVAELEREEEDGTTPIHLLFDSAMHAAIDNGCEGVEDVKPDAARGGRDE